LGIARHRPELARKQPIRRLRSVKKTPSSLVSSLNVGERHTRIASMQGSITELSTGIVPTAECDPRKSVAKEREIRGDPWREQDLNPW
jgi:hypothetical protein